MNVISLDDTDRAIVNGLQGGFPLSEDPFNDAGVELGLSGEELLARVSRLLDDGALSRFGPFTMPK